MEHSGGSVEADHLCVLVHGLWGNPNHMRNIAKSLHAQYPPDQLYILVAKRNSDSFTYDGIELGGERVCAEIEEELRAIEGRGGKIKKISVVGYSLGGLVARYAVGLLYAKGVLDGLECLNFTTFATPHLGVRSPLRGWHNHLWNVLGARMLSTSGRQLFTVDSFRDTGRPLLEVLADPKSIFVSGLKMFRRRTLYTNIANDRSAVYYTTAISKTDPFTDLQNVKVNYVEGYEDVILDPRSPVMPRPKTPRPATFSSAVSAATTWLRRVPFLLALAVFVPVGIVAFFVNAAVQTARSTKRIRLHEKGLGGVATSAYRVPLWIKEVRGEVELAYEALNSSQRQSYLGDGAEGEGEEAGLDAETGRMMARERRLSLSAQPTLALAPYQFRMIQALDEVGWRKYPVWIHDDRHSHAAIIVRRDGPTFEEGWVVFRHWLTEEFIV